MKKLYSLVAVMAISTGVFAQTVLLADNFAALKGDNTTSNGSSTTWAGDSLFPTVNKAYQAGGAVKFGTGSLNGSMTSMPLDLSTDGGTFTVEFDVKGWSTVEGTIDVTVTGLAKQSFTYTAVMSGSFEHAKLTFTGGAANSTITIGTSAKRAFVDNVTVTTVPAPLAVVNADATKKSLVKNAVVANELLFGAKANVKIYNMNGQMVKAADVVDGTRLDVSSLAKGIYIVAGEVEGQKVSQKVIKK